MKTPIRWAGSKKSLLPQLKELSQRITGRYIEPFCGSACLFFDLEPNQGLLGDINQEIITTYRALKSKPRQVLECLLRLPKIQAQYYSLRRLSPCNLSDIEVAARFIFLNRLCFNGIYRTNLKGEFNVPYAKPKSRVEFDADAFLQMSTVLKRAVLLNDDFEVLLEEAERGDFVYLDPPYAIAKRRVFSEYHPDSFSEDDIARLRKALRKLDRKGARFVISYGDSPEGRAISRDWFNKRVRTRRNVAGFAGDRRVAYEIIASNCELSNVS